MEFYMGVDIYRNYIVIIEEGSLSAASRKLRTAQPALSNQMKTLEEKFGTKLVVMKKGVRRIQLTEAGQVLYEKAKYLCELEEVAAREIRELKDGVSGALRIGLSPAASDQVVKQFLADFHDLYPNIRFELYEVSPDEISELLLSGICEIGIVRASLQQPELFHHYSLDRERLAVLFLKNGAWLKDAGTSVSLLDLEGIPLCLTRGWLKFIEKSFSEFNIAPKILCISTARLCSLTWAMEGKGVALVPVDSLERFSEKLSCVAISEENYSINKSLITLKTKSLSAVGQRFLLHCREKLNKKWELF